MDPVVLLATTLQAGVALAVMFVVPGLALGPFLAPGASTPLARAGRAIGVSLLTTSIGCTLLAGLGILSPLTSLVTVGVVVLLGLVGARRSGWRLRSPTHRRWQWLGGAGAGAVLALVLVVLPSRMAVGDALLPYTSTVWYYANLARSVALEGGLPVSLPEWGTTLPFQTDYLPFTAQTAATLQLLPGDLTLQLEVYRLALLVVGLALATLLFRRWVSSWIALLGALLLFASERLAFKYLAYKPETFGFDLALFGLWLLDRALVERSRRLAVLAAVNGAVLFLAHAEVFLVYLAFAVGLVAARCVVTRRGRVGLGLRPGAAMTVGLGIAILAAGGVGGTLANGALTGSFRILGYVAGDATPGTGTTGEALDRAEVPPGWTFTGDPTWDFYVAAVAPAQMGLPVPSRFVDSRLLPRSILVVWPGLDGRSVVMLLVIAGLVMLPVLAWPWLDPRRRRAVVSLAGLGIALFAGSYLLFAFSDTYVPMRTGPRRIMPYEALVVVGAGMFLLWAVDRAAASGWRALFPRRGAMVAAGTSLAILSAAMLSSGSVTAIDDPEPGISPVGYEAYRWMDANLPADARILANAYTDGALTALSRRVGIIDGRAVYLEDPEFLRASTALCLGARVVFSDPGGPGASSFLQRERVDYLLVVGPDGSGNDIGGYDPFETDEAALADGRRYTRVRTFGDGRLSLYQVERGG